MEESSDLSQVAEEQAPVIPSSESPQSTLEQKRQAERDMYSKLMGDMRETQLKLDPEGKNSFYYDIPRQINVKDAEGKRTEDGGSAFVLRHVSKSDTDGSDSVVCITENGVYRANFNFRFQDNPDEQRKFMRGLGRTSKLPRDSELYKSKRDRVIESSYGVQLFVEGTNWINTDPMSKLSLTEDADFVQQVFQGSVEDAKADILRAKEQAEAERRQKEEEESSQRAAEQARVAEEERRLQEERERIEKETREREEAEQEKMRLAEEERKRQEQQEMDRIDTELEGVDSLSSLMGNLTSGGSGGSE